MLTIRRPRGKKMAVAKQNLWLDKDKKKILTSEPDRGFVLAVEGAAITDEDIDLYDIPDKYLEDEPEKPEEVPNIVISGGTKSGPAVVVGQPLEDEDSEPATSQKAGRKSGKLPNDFPGRAALESAGITTYAQLRKGGDLGEIEGIGPSTKEKIDEALAE